MKNITRNIEVKSSNEAGAAVDVSDMKELHIQAYLPASHCTFEGSLDGVNFFTIDAELTSSGQINVSDNTGVKWATVNFIRAVTNSYSSGAPKACVAGKEHGA